MCLDIDDDNMCLDNDDYICNYIWMCLDIDDNTFAIIFGCV